MHRYRTSVAAAGSAAGLAVGSAEMVAGSAEMVAAPLAQESLQLQQSAPFAYPSCTDCSRANPRKMCSSRMSPTRQIPTTAAA